MAKIFIHDRILQEADSYIKILKQEAISNPNLQLKLKLSYYFGAPYNNQLRQAAYYLLTGEAKPINECSIIQIKDRLIQEIKNEKKD